MLCCIFSIRLSGSIATDWYEQIMVKPVICGIIEYVGKDFASPDHLLDVHAITQWQRVVTVKAAKSIIGRMKAELDQHQAKIA